MVKTHPVPQTLSRTLNFTGVSLLKFNSEINAALEINYTFAGRGPREELSTAPLFERHLC